MVVIVVLMVVMTAGIGAGFGIEWSLDRIDMAAKALDHLRYYVIGSNTDAIAQQLHRQMPITQMPSYADEFVGPMGMDFHQLLGLRADPDDAGLHQQPIAVTQPYCLRQVDQYFGSGLRGQNDTASEAVIVVDQHAIDLLAAVPASGGEDLRGFDQNRKYRCAIGRMVAGSQVSSTPSARTS